MGTRKRKLSIKDFNRCHPGRKSRSNKTCLPSSVYSELMEQHSAASEEALFQAVGCEPGAEHCLLDRTTMDEFRKKELRKHYLRPKMPKAWISDPDMWLDNYNILHVMKQYEESEKGIRGIGTIFNLDPHFIGGSHWVALYIDLKNINKPIISYFDSYGYKTPALIARLMRSLKLQIKGCQLGYNARRFQYGSSECGMFSMYFIICMMNGIPFRSFCKDSVNDKMMLELRKILFAK